MAKQLQAALRQQRSSSRPPRTVGRFWIAALASISLITAVAVWLVVEQVGADARDLREETLRVGASHMVEELATRGYTVRNQLALWAQEARVRTAFEYADQTNFAAEEQRLLQRLPGAVAVHLVRLETSATGIRLHPASEQRLSYAGADLVRQVVESRQVSLLEAHRVKQQDVHLAIAQPVLAEDGRTVLGVIHLALPLSLLPKPSQQFAAIAKTAFQQIIGTDSTVLTSGVTVPDSDSVLIHTAPVPTTRIQLTVWRRLPAVTDMRLFGVAMMVLALALVLQILIGTAAVIAQRQRLRSDVAQCTAALASLMNRQVPGKRRLGCDELVLLDSALEQFTQFAAAQSVATTSALLTNSTTATDFEGQFPDLLPSSTIARDPTSLLASSVAAHSNTLHSTTALSSLPVQRIPPPQLDGLGTIPARVFRPYDIRGLVDSEMNDEFMRLLGRVVATEALERGTRSFLIGRDYRSSSQRLAAAFIDGLRASGCNVIDLGLVPTPVLYFTSHLAGDISGAVITASHHPLEYNGLKLVFAGQSATALTIAKLRQRLQHGQVADGAGNYHEQAVLTDYLDEVEQNIKLSRRLKIVVDGGFGTPALIAPPLYRALGCEVIELRCDLSDARTGTTMFNPTDPNQLQSLADAVRNSGADLGLGFDGDGGRLGVVDNSGTQITTDRILMLLATQMLAQQPNKDIVFDVQCSSRLAELIHRNGGRPVMWKSGHAFLKEKRHEINAPLAGEFSGHIIFGDRWNGFDDAFYAGARLLEVLAQEQRSSQAVFADYPVGVSTPELIVAVSPGEEQAIMAMVLEAKGRLSGVRVSTIDGLRADSEQGWALVRASNTESALVFRFEADDQVTLGKLQDLFRRLMKMVAPKLTLPF